MRYLIAAGVVSNCALLAYASYVLLFGAFVAYMQGRIGVTELLLFGVCWGFIAETMFLFLEGFRRSRAWPW